jgi:hypothetical protein
VQKEEVLKRITDVIDKNLAMVQKIGFFRRRGIGNRTDAKLYLETYKESNIRKGVQTKWHLIKNEHKLCPEFFYRSNCQQKNHDGERICGDVFYSKRLQDENGLLLFFRWNGTWRKGKCFSHANLYYGF